MLNDVTQDQLFDEEVAPFITSAVQGGNATVFAYGPTGAGKTHTMQGYNGNEGIIPRAMDALFAEMAEEEVAGTCTEHTLTMSYLEIYNEKVKDLIDPKEDLPIRAQQDGTIFIPNLGEAGLDSAEEFRTVFTAANAQRSVGSTTLNSISSRSHAVLIVKMVKTVCESGKKLHGKLHLIDLAGSEDNRKTDNVGVRMKESNNINTSLFVLGKVVDALNRKDNRVPYRDSKLTRLLQDSLGGSSRSCMIVNVAPNAGFVDSTLSALTFGSKSRNIVNVVEQAKPRSATPIRAARPQKRARTAESVTSGGADTPKRARVDDKKPKAPTDAFGNVLFLKKKKVVKKVGTTKKSGGETGDGESTKTPQPPRTPSTPLHGRRLNVRNEGAFPPAMTPGSKVQIVNAMITQGKAYEKYDKHAALAHYEKAHKLFPAKPKLGARITKLRNEIHKEAGRSPLRAVNTPGADGNVKRKRKGTFMVKKQQTLAESVFATPAQKKGKLNATGERECPGTYLKPSVGFASRLSTDGDPDWNPADVTDGEDDTGAELKKAKQDLKNKRRTFAVPECNAYNSPLPGHGTPSISLGVTGEFADFFKATEEGVLKTLNEGGIKELMVLKGVGKVRAQAIIKYREVTDGFAAVDDLKKVGCGAKMIGQLYDAICA
jgi:DNA uptake protein ComE-like DNA-binding protein